MYMYVCMLPLLTYFSLYPDLCGFTILTFTCTIQGHSDFALVVPTRKCCPGLLPHCLSFSSYLFCLVLQHSSVLHLLFSVMTVMINDPYN